MVRKAQSTDHPEFPHGANAGYARGCRCVVCKGAHAASVRENWLKNHPEPRHAYREHGGDVNHLDFPHGQNAGYVAGCRCEACAEARRVSFRVYSREKRIPGTPGGLKKAVSNTVYRKSEKGLIASRKGNATRAARKRDAMISVSEAEQNMLRWIYAHCPEGYEVDHIIALVNGGSHTPENLQYLPLSVNRRKGGRHDFDVSEHVTRWQDILDVALNDHPLAGVGASAPKRVGPPKEAMI